MRLLSSKRRDKKKWGDEGKKTGKTTLDALKCNGANEDGLTARL